MPQGVEGFLPAQLEQMPFDFAHARDLLDLILSELLFSAGLSALCLFMGPQLRVPPFRHTYGTQRAGSAVHKRDQLKEAEEIPTRTVGQLNELALFDTNNLMQMYVKRGNMVDARHVFDNVRKRNVVSWNIMIVGYANQDDSARALELYALMHRENVHPTDRTFIGALKACRCLAQVEEGKRNDGNSVKTLDKGRVIHFQIVKNGLELDVFVGTTLVDMYVKCGNLQDAQRVLEELPHRNLISWNAMILGYAQQEEAAQAFELYIQMHQEGVEPDDRTFVGALKACSSLAALEEGKKVDRRFTKSECLEKGRAIHSKAVKSALESDLFVATTLVHMYAKCGSLEDAQGVFDELPHRDVVSWNAMILGYANQDDGALALDLYARMCQEGAQPNDGTFVSILKACSSVAALEEGNFHKIGCWQEGRAIHSQLVKRGLESDVSLGNTLVDMYSKCGSLEDAQCVFDNLPSHDVVSWNAIILGYAKRGQGIRALDLYARMCQEGVKPDERTFVGTLKACSSLPAVEGKQLERKFERLEKGRTLHSQAVKTGFEPDVFVGNTLLDMYVTFGSLEDAQCVFDQLLQRDIVSWNTIVLGYAQQDEGAQALELFGQMFQEGIQPDDLTFIGVLKACSSLAALADSKQVDGKLVQTGCLEFSRAIHFQIVKSRFESDVFVATTLADAYVKCGSLEDAQHVFDKLPNRDVVSWNAMILGYVKQEDGALALDLYSRLHQEGLQPGELTFIGALKACSCLAGLEGGNREVQKTECLKKGRSIHSHVVKCGFESHLFVGNILVDIYGKFGSLEDAWCVFEDLPTRDVVSWNAMILGYSKQEEGALSLNLYAQMHQEGVQPDDRSFVGALKACSSLATLEERQQVGREGAKTGWLQKGKGIHSEVIKSGFESDVFLATTLVDMYAKCGSLDDAQHVFDELLPHRAVVSWNAMIQGYAKQEESEEAFKLYAEMQEQGLSPDSFTFVAVLSACGNTGALEIAKELYSQISSSSYDNSPFLVVSLIDIYAKCGSMADAQILFDALPTRDVVPWNALLAGYSHQGESELVFRLFERMRQEGIQPDEPTFLSVFTVCSHVGLVDWGQIYFQVMSKQHGIVPTLEHYSCMVDLFGRAGQLDEAVAIVEKMPFQPSVVVWLTILGACRKWKNVEAGRHAFENVVGLDENISAAYVSMANIYADAHMHQDCDRIEVIRRNAQERQMPAKSQMHPGMSSEWCIYQQEITANPRTNLDMLS